jgi:hypothetical protein
VSEKLKISLGNIAGYGNGSSAHLICQADFLGVRKNRGELVRGYRELNASLPNS